MAAFNSLRRSPLRWPLAVGLLALVLALIGFSSNLSGAARATESTGTLSVDGSDYVFSPTTCGITDDDFVVSGPGEQGEEEFVVSASSGSVELAFGIVSEIDTPASSEMWLANAQEIEWSRAGDTVEATLSMIDRNHADVAPVDAELSVICATEG